MFVAENSLTLIPARSGSKRLPGKNIKPLGGIPLLAWSILAAKKANLGRIHVSTDNEEYAGIARQFGADMPFLRSAKTSTDEASSADVVREVLQLYETRSGFSPKWIILLQPTSPFRDPATIAAGIKLFQESGGSSVVAVARNRIPAHWMVDLNDNASLIPHSSTVRIPEYHFCGTFYAFTAETVMTTGSLYSPDVKGLIVESSIEALDIDTLADWELAEAISILKRDMIITY